MAEQHEKALVPQIRFAGFTDPWEQRKLGEVARRVTRKNENGDSDLPLTISAQYGLVDQRTFFNSQVASKDMSGYFLLHRGEFAYNKSTSTDSPWGAIKRLEKYDMGCVSTLYICFELLSGDPDFLVTYYETDRWYKSVQLIAAEGARNHGLLNIAPDDFFETQICIPKRIDEQRRIGAFFDRLDSLITLHQRKYDKLCVLKKSMLDKMFPKGGSLYPEIRFAGFTDPWEQRKLGELFEEHSEKDRDDLPALTIIQGGGTVHRDESNRNLQFDRNSLSNYKVVDTGDFIVHLRSFEGGLEKATCCGLVSPAYHIFRGKNVDSDFYYLYFRSKRFIDADLKPHVYGIRDGRSIDIEGMKTIFIPWTNLAEQRRIGAFFDHLDSLITLHQRKYCGVVSWMLGVALVRLSSEK